MFVFECVRSFYYIRQKREKWTSSILSSIVLLFIHQDRPTHKGLHSEDDNGTGSLATFCQQALRTALHVTMTRADKMLTLEKWSAVNYITLCI